MFRRRVLIFYEKEGLYLEIFLGRQPIFNLDEEIVAYELLYRSETKNSFTQIDSDTATMNVISNAFINMDFEEVTNGKPSFINFTDTLLNDNLLNYLDPKNVVIEVLENVEITEGLIERIQEIKSLGFRIALDDFVMQKDVTLYSKLFQYIDYIKVDFLLASLAERLQIEKIVKEKFPHIQLLAEKVETRHQFDVAVNSGYTLFQGYFFQQPQVIVANDIPANVVQYLQVLTLLRDDEVSMNEISIQIERDISLSYKLLRLINNSGRRQKLKVRSIKQALLMVGLDDFRRWLFLITMKELPSTNYQDVYHELMKESLFRAKICNMVALKHQHKNHSEYFLIGLFSLIDTILKRPLDKILYRIPLSEEIVQTLLGSETSKTPYLKFSVALSKAQFEKAVEIGRQLDLTEDMIIEIKRSADEWVKRTYQQ